jgi:hypothetical protein
VVCRNELPAHLESNPKKKNESALDNNSTHNTAKFFTTFPSTQFPIFHIDTATLARQKHIKFRMKVITKVYSSQINYHKHTHWIVNYLRKYVLPVPDQRMIFHGRVKNVSTPSLTQSVHSIRKKLCLKCKHSYNIGERLPKIINP